MPKAKNDKKEKVAVEIEVEDSEEEKGKEDSPEKKSVIDEIKKVTTDFVNASVTFINEKVENIKDEEKRKAFIEQSKKNIDNVVAESKKQIEKVRTNENVIAAVEKTKEVSKAAFEKIVEVGKEVTKKENIKKAADTVVQGAQTVYDKSKEAIQKGLEKHPDLIPNMKSAGKSAVDKTKSFVGNLTKKKEKPVTEEEPKECEMEVEACPLTEAQAGETAETETVEKK